MCVTLNAMSPSCRYHTVGTALLDDQQGCIVPCIAATTSLLGQPDLIATEVLRRWVQGKRCSWQLLVSVLRSTGLQALAEDVEEVLGGVVMQLQ